MPDNHYDDFIRQCPYCGCTEMIEAYQTMYGSITSPSNKLCREPLYHTVCRGCGGVLRSYVKDPEKLLRRRDRR